MKKIALSTLFLSAIFTLASCAGGESGSNSSLSSEVPSSSNSSQSIVPIGDALVIYFSATGHTEEVASTIANHLEAPIHALEPVDPYTSEDLNYGNNASRVSLEYAERNDGDDEDVHVDLVTTSFEEFASSEYIFLGAPIWWGELSWVIEDFVRENDFTGKTIIPFGTSASTSSFPLTHLMPLAEEATWAEPQRFSSYASEDTIISWVDSLPYAFA